mgnify:CR=1 FL=1
MPRRALSVLGAVVLTATVSVAPVLASPLTPQDATPFTQSTSPDADLTVERLAGSDRYGTAAEIAKQWSGTVDHLYVVSGDTPYDAAIAAARAGVDDVPVLLTKRSTLPAASIEQLNRLKPRTITVVGGTTAVSKRVEQELRDYAGSGGVERVPASDQYSRSASLAALYAVGPDRVYLASGEDYADGLAAAALAGSTHEPLMLTKGNSLPASVAAQLARLKPREVVIVGGASAVSNAVLNQAATYATTGQATRLAGEDRYQTAAAVAREFPSTVDSVYLASGVHHADALVVSALAAREETAVVLTPRNAAAAGTLDAMDYLAPGTLAVVGGTAAVSDRVIDDIRGARPPAPQPPVDPEPPAPEPPADPEPPAEFPDEDSTGVPDGITLTPSERLTITQDGTVVDAKHVNGPIVIEADNVTVRNTLVQTATNLYPIQIKGGATGTLIENVEVDNLGGSGIGILVQGSGTIRGVNVHSGKLGMQITGDNVTVEESYFHDLVRIPGGHHDTIQIRSGDNVTIRYNNLQPYKASTNDPMNAAIQIGSLAGTDQITNLNVIGNLMNGGNFTLNGGGRGEVESARYAENQFGRDFRYGPVSSLQNSEWDDTNVWFDTGEPVL